MRETKGFVRSDVAIVSNSGYRWNLDVEDLRMRFVMAVMATLKIQGLVVGPVTARYSTISNVIFVCEFLIYDAKV